MFRQGLISMFFTSFFYVHYFQVPKNPHRVRWDLFVTNPSNTKGVSPSRSSVMKTRQKPLPPVLNSNLTSKTNRVSDRQTSIKPVALPPIENTKKTVQNLPIIFLLSKFFHFNKQIFPLFFV